MNSEKKVIIDNQLWYALGLLGQLGFVIAVPLVIFGLIGRFLDKKFDTSPWLLLAGLFISMIISSIWVFIKVSQITKQMEEKVKIQDSKVKSSSQN